MSLILVKEPSTTQVVKTNELSLGTWFMDSHNQIYVVVLDDRTHEKRVLCTGNYYKPFIANLPLGEFEVNKILQIGTQLQITGITAYGDDDA